MAARRAASFRRREARFSPQPRILVLCEDSKASVDYLNDAARHVRASPHVHIKHAGRTDPLGIVLMALDEPRRWDEAFCVIDRNGHANFDQALALAQGKAGLWVIPTYPCFEYWLLLHCGYQRAGFMPVGAKSACDRLIDVLRQRDGFADYDKAAVRGLFDRLLVDDRFDQARQHALHAHADAVAVGELNPSTLLHVLMDRFEALGNLQPLS